jgi:hypothetical protein
VISHWLGVRRNTIAHGATQFLAEPACASVLRHDPGPLHKWRGVADVLFVAALKLGDPLPLGVEMEADDASFHKDKLAREQDSGRAILARFYR